MAVYGPAQAGNTQGHCPDDIVGDTAAGPGVPVLDAP